MEYNSITPIFFVEKIEPCLFFWMGRLGFQKAVEVYEGDQLGFVLLVNDQVQIMYQSYLSLQKDLPNLAKTLNKKHKSTVYVKLSDIEWMTKHLDGVEIISPLRTSFYGAREICVQEPGGHLVIFSEFTSGKADQAGF